MSPGTNIETVTRQGDTPVFRVGEVAEITGWSRSTIRRAADEGELKSSVTPGGHHRFKPDDVVDYLVDFCGWEEPEAVAGVVEMVRVLQPSS